MVWWWWWVGGVGVVGIVCVCVGVWAGGWGGGWGGGAGGCWCRGNVSADPAPANALQKRPPAHPCPPDFLVPLAAKMAEEPFKLVIMVRGGGGDGQGSNARSHHIPTPATALARTRSWPTCAPILWAAASWPVSAMPAASAPPTLTHLPGPAPSLPRPPERQQRLGQLMQRLRKLAEEFNCAVLVTNQVCVRVCVGGGGLASGEGT